jgi:ABC-2 type transport system permease protein
MLRNVYLKSLRDGRRGLVGWGVGIALLVLTEGAFWPAMRDMPNLDQFLASYPEAMRELFDLEAMTSGTGFMNAELFSALLPLLFIMYGVSHGARAIAGEEGSGTLDVLLVTPVTPRRLLAEKAAALATLTVALGVVLWAATMLASVTFSMGMDPVDVLGGCVAMVLLGVEFGWAALAVGAILGRKALAVAAASAVAVLAYVVFVAAVFVDGLDAVQPYSPFAQALDDGPVGGALVPLSYLWLLLAPVAALAVAVPMFEHRDIAVGRRGA